MNNKPVKTLNNESSLLLKPSENLILLLNQFNNAFPESNTDLEMLLSLNIAILMNCKIWKYQTKINPWPYFISMPVPKIKIFTQNTS